jgi:hypothetical protein
MARDLVERELSVARSDGTGFAIATAADDADIRGLLRENPMRGGISLSFEREPDYFADAGLPAEMKQTIIARRAGRVVCAGSCTVRRRFVNGNPCRVGYLGGLRLDESVAGKFGIVRRGYEFFRAIQADAPADFYFTSIAADNERARRLLERGLPGMPLYEYIGDYPTILLPTKRRSAVSGALVEAGPSMEQFMPRLNLHNARHQFAPCWSADELNALQPLGLLPQDFRVVHEGGRIVAGAALWDQRVFKQTAIRGYAPFLAFARPALNLAARLTGAVRLPAIGQTLANAFISHLAVAPDEPEMLPGLLEEFRQLAAQRGIDLLTLGFAAKDPQLAILRGRFRCREYHSRLYVVRWPEFGGSAGELDGRIPAPEVALL